MLLFVLIIFPVQTHPFIVFFKKSPMDSFDPFRGNDDDTRHTFVNPGVCVCVCFRMDAVQGHKRSFLTLFILELTTRG